MTTPTPFSPDVESLLLPIAPDAPAGGPLRYEGTYDRIQEARREDDASLPQGVWKAPLKKANWSQVATLCQEALRQKTKDFQLAAWLLEAWLELHGFRGVEAGLRLMVGLAERFWDTAWPALDAEDPTGRLAPLAWLDEKAVLRLKGIALVRTQGTEAVTYSYADWEAATHRERTVRGGTPPKSATNGPEAVTQARFMSAVSLTPASFLSGLARDVGAALDAAIALEQAFDSRLGRAQASLHRFRALLGSLRDLLVSLRGAAGTAAASTPEGAEDAAAAPEDAPEAPRGGGPIRDRMDAYRRLIEVADYLLRTEPHSPTPYLIKRAVSWGEMPLGQLLQEIVQTPQDLKAIYSLLGMREQPPQK
ncbi:type VI secretion system protein TssA [Archangium sp.]|jgi:type VI secretion system protein ImpA|uniref:type VI secretion system protein TssA n=1 Tax=Archangium sp. TaxID=1872627 RepID=UPI002EDACFA9